MSYHRLDLSERGVCLVFDRGSSNGAPRGVCG